MVSAVASTPMISLSDSHAEEELTLLDRTYIVGTATLSQLGSLLHGAVVGPLNAGIRIKNIVVGMYSEGFCNYARAAEEPVLEVRNEDEVILNFPIDSRGKTRVIVSSKGNEEDFLSICWLLQVIHERVLDPRQRVLLTSEVMAKALAYRDLDVGRFVPVPTIDADGNPTRTLYRVDEEFDLWKDFPAYGLVPADLHERLDHPPILLYRGTSLSVSSAGGPASIVSSLDPNGSGLVPFENRKDDLEAWLQKVTRHGCKVRAIGNGVGGSMVMYTALSLGQYLSRDENGPSVAFGPLGVAKATYGHWLAQEETEKPLLELYLTQGDVVPKFGYLFGDAYEMVSEERLSPYTAHLQLMLLSEECNVFPVDLAKENTSESRKTCHAWQEQDLPAVYKFLHWGLMGLAYPISRLTSNEANESWLGAAYNASYLGSTFLGFV